MNTTDLSGAAWRKSSHSNGQANCVEVAAVSGAAWRKSSYSNGQSECVEIAVTAGSNERSERVIAVRDSKDPAGPKLVFTAGEWAAFTARVRAGQFGAG